MDPQSLSLSHTHAHRSTCIYYSLSLPPHTHTHKHVYPVSVSLSHTHTEARVYTTVSVSPHTHIHRSTCTQSLSLSHTEANILLNLFNTTTLLQIHSVTEHLPKMSNTFKRSKPPPNQATATSVVQNHYVHSCCQPGGASVVAWSTHHSNS